MAEYDLVVRGGAVATAFGTMRCDIGVRGGRIVALAERIEGGAATLGLDGSRLAVGGDSAGGTLAATCAIHARDAGLPLALQLLITPGTTAHADTASHKLFANGFLLDAANVAWFFDHTIAHQHRRVRHALEH